VKIHRQESRVTTDPLFTTTFDDSDDWETVQRAIGSALRISMEEVTREHFPGNIARCS